MPVSPQLLEREPDIREQGPLPADGSAATANPPAFRWLIHEGVALWKVFLTGPREQRLEFGPLADPILALPKRLSPGEWRWQYVGLDLAGREAGRGRERRFAVRPGLSGFAVPDISRLERRWRSLRPRILPRRMAEVRERLKTGRPDAFRRLQEWCRLAESEPLGTEPAGFGPHPQDSEAWNRDWVRIYSAGKIGSAHAARFAASFLLTGNPKHLELAKRWALSLIGWNPFGSTGEYVNDEASMPMLERLAWVYDWLHPHWSEEERRRCQACLLIRGQEVMLKYQRINFAAKPFNNHMCRQLAFLGGAGVAFLGEIPQAAGWLKYVLDILAVSYPSGSWGSADGGWANGLSYWSAYMSFLMTFLATADELGIPLIQGAYYRNTGYFAAYHLPPYAPRGGFGDHGEGGPGFNHKLVVGTFGRVADDQALCWYADQIPAPAGDPAKMLADDKQYCPARRWDAWFLPELAELLLMPERRPAKPSQPALPAARHFPAIGWVSMHSALGDAGRDAWIEFKSSPFGSPGHSHADQNSFNLYAHGQALLLDSGYYPWYGSPHDTLWTRQTWAHNAVLVGGRGQPPWDWRARGQVASFADVPPFAYARGEAAAAYNRPPSDEAAEMARKHLPQLLERMGPASEVRRASRTVLMLGGERPWFAVLDWLETAAPVKFQWLAHACEAMSLLPSEPGFDVQRGDIRLAVRFAWPRALSLSQTDQFCLPPEGRAKGEPNQWHLAAETVEPACTARFVAALVPCRNGQTTLPVLPIHEDGVVGARVGDSTVLVPESGTAGAIRCGEIEAQAALLAIHAGRVLAAEATRLTVNGRTVHESAEPETVVNRRSRT